MQPKKEKEVTGIIYKRRAANEADVFARILTEKDGLFSIAVKGALKPKSKLNAGTLNFSFGNYKIMTNQTGIATLRATGHVATFDALFSDLKLNAYASYMLDLVDHGFVEYKDVGATYNLVQSCLKNLNGGMNPEVVLALFELQLLPVFGIGPELAQCVICGKTSGTFDYSIDLGGIICSDHFNQVKSRLHLPPKAVALIRTLGLIDVTKLGNISVSEALITAVLKAIDRIYRQTLDLSLKSKAFIDSMHFW